MSESEPIITPKSMAQVSEILDAGVGQPRDVEAYPLDDGTTFVRLDLPNDKTTTTRILEPDIKPKATG